jgi:hypothetical protein
MFTFAQLSSAPLNYSIFFCRRMEHAVHLTAGHFITDVSSLSAKAVVAKAKKLRKKLMADNPGMDDKELLKSAYRNGHLSATEEAKKRVTAALDALDDEIDA